VINLTFLHDYIITLILKGKNNPYYASEMKIDHEKVVLEAMYLAKFVSGEIYLRMFEISVLTGIRNSSLQRLLRRLVRIGWIEQKSGLSYSKWSPKGKVGLLEWVRLKDSKGNRRKALMPKETLDEYPKQILQLTRTLPASRRKGRMEPKTESYLEVVNQMDRRKRNRILRQNSLSFKGKTKLLRKLLGKEIPKREYTFYRLLVFPYILDRRIGGHMKANENDKVLPTWDDVPKKYENYWKEASNELKQFIMSLS